MQNLCLAQNQYAISAFYDTYFRAFNLSPFMNALYLV